MDTAVAPLDPSASLPSLLACLPTASASPSPPPALLPLLSPILRQRLQLLSESPSTTSWLPLLNWNPQEAAQLSKTIEAASLEPHPVSGEIELAVDPDAPQYRRLDEETLQALVNIPDVGLAVVYVWATADNTLAWKISELKPLHAGLQKDPTPWTNSIRAAEDAFESKTHRPSIVEHLDNSDEQDGEEEDDGYWDRYDATPGRTPARTPPAPAQKKGPQSKSSSKAGVDGVEDSYWAQYGSVQPALDAEDPDGLAGAKDLGQSTLNGNALLAAESSQPGRSAESAPSSRGMPTANGSTSEESRLSHPLFTPNGTGTADSGVAFGLQAFLGKREAAVATGGDSSEHIAHPRPRSHSANSASSGKSALVEQLEGQAESKVSLDGDRKNSVVAEFAIQQHISTSMKSLFRLAKGAGMQRVEFERIVQAELGVLGILDDE